MRACRACGFEHGSLIRCEVAKRIRDAGSSRVVNVVANAVPVVANKESRHGKHKDPEKRKVYMRDLMRARRRGGLA